MNVMVIAPHPDDEAIGCGGTLCLHSMRGDRVTAVFLTSGELGLQNLPQEEAWRVREDEARAAGTILGLATLAFLRRPDWFVAEGVEAAAAALYPSLEADAPQLIYLPHPGEWHPDHRAALAVVLLALQGCPGLLPTLRTFEVWTPLSDYDCVENISKVMARKLLAIRCYRSQLESFSYDRAVRGLGQYRGALAGRCNYAEVFKAATSDGFS